MEISSSALFYTAEIVTINESWIITFKIPGLLDNLDEYPEAAPITDHIYQLHPGDEVIIIRPNQISNTTFFYVPNSIRRYVGIKNGNNSVDATNEEVLNIGGNSIKNYYTKEFKIVHSEVPTNELDADDISNDVLSIDNSGTVTIPGNLTVAGSLKINTGYTGLITTEFGAYQVLNGIIIGGT